MPASVPESPVEFMPVAPLRFERVPDIEVPDESVLPDPIDDEPVLPLPIEPVEPDVLLPEPIEPEPVVPLPIELEPLVLPVPPAELGVLVVLPVPGDPVLPELIDPVEPVPAVPEPVVALPEPVVPLLPIELAEPLLPVPELLVPEPVEPVVLLPPGVVADPVDEPVVPVPLVPLVALVPVDPVDPVCATVTPAPNASAMPAARAARVCLDALFMMILQVDVTGRSKCRKGTAIDSAPWTQHHGVGNAHAANGAAMPPEVASWCRPSPTRGRARRAGQGPRWVSGSAAPAFTSPSEKLVWRSFTCGRFSSVSSEKRENASRSVAITCSSNVPEPEM